MGGGAEYVTVPVENLIQLPDNVSYEEAAMLEPMAVTVHAIRRAMLSDADTIAVCGLGTIGLLLLMFLLESVEDSEKILVIGNKDFQQQTVIKMELPKECYCDNRNGNVGRWIMEHTDGKGVDVFFECVGKNETLIHAVDNTAPAGRVVLVGNPYSAMRLEKALYWKILRNQLMLVGTWNSSLMHEPDDDWYYALGRLSQNLVSPKGLITHRLPLEGLEQGLHIMRNKTEGYVKVMGIME